MLERSLRAGEASIVTAAVVSNESVGIDLFRLHLDLPRHWGPPLPGQFISITLEPDWDERAIGEAGDALLRRPFGVSGFEIKEGNATVEIIYARLGRVTRRMAGLGAGDKINVLGPLGTSFPLSGTGPAILVAGGRGIGPLLFLARMLDARESFTLIYGARTAGELVPLPAMKSGEVLLATDDGSRGRKASAAQVLEGLPHSTEARVMACGPPVMLRVTSEIAAARGWPCWVALEEFFGCGLGLCGSCAVPAAGAQDAYERYLWVCRDGPVMAAERIDWSACVTRPGTRARGES